MKLMTESEMQKLSFPDCQVEKMHIDIHNKIVEIQTSCGYLDMAPGIVVKTCKVIIKNWRSISASLYRADTKKWEKQNQENIEKLNDICEFNYGKDIILRGFGVETGQWIEIVINEAILEVQYL